MAGQCSYIQSEYVNFGSLLFSGNLVLQVETLKRIVVVVLYKTAMSESVADRLATAVEVVSIKESASIGDDERAASATSAYHSLLYLARRIRCMLRRTFNPSTRLWTTSFWMGGLHGTATR